jgi:hypothetical protein
MLKHCQATANDQTRRSRRHLQLSNSNLNKSDNASVSSAQTFFLAASESPDFRRSSLYSSPDQPLSMNSRASSFASLNLTHLDSKMSPIKIYARCLRSDIEYKTLSVSHRTTSTEVIWMLLSKYKMRHRDPKLFYLTMEIGVQQPDNASANGADGESSRTLVLDDDARPAELKSCYPWGDCRFTLQMRKGGLVRIHDSVLMAESKYKCLLISDQTTVREVINILFHCYGLERIERVDRFCLYEVSSDDFQSGTKLRPDDCPAVVQTSWTSPAERQFVLKRDQVSSSVATTTTAPPMSTSSTTSERSLSSCDDHMDETEMSMDTSYSNTSSSSSSSTSSESPVPPSSPERMSSSSSSSSSSVDSPLSPPRLTLNQSVQTSVVRNGLHLNSHVGRCTSVDGPPRSLPAVVRTVKNQMSQTTCHYLPLVHKPLQPQQPKTNFNLNYPVSTVPACIVPFQQQQQSRMVPSRMTSVTSIHESGLPPPPPRPSQANRVLLSLTSQPQSLLTMGPGTRRPVVSFHDYENYFYI